MKNLALQNYALLILNNILLHGVLFASRIFHSFAIKSNGSGSNPQKDKRSDAFYIPWVFSLVSNTLSSSLFLPSHSFHTSRSSVSLAPIFSFLPGLFSRLVRDQHSQSLCHRGLIHHKYKLAEHSRVCAHKWSHVSACMHSYVRACVYAHGNEREC